MRRSLPYMQAIKELAANEPSKETRLSRKELGRLDGGHYHHRFDRRYY